MNKLHTSHKGHTVAKPTTLFDKDVISDITKTAKANLLRDKFLEPVLFIKTSKIDKFLIVPIKPDADKREYLTALSYILKQKADKFGELQEAIMLSDACFVVAKGSIKNVKLPLKDNPDTKEAIILVGRNNSNNRYLTAMYPYLKIKDTFKFDIKAKVFELNNKKASSRGLLDYLFTPEFASQLESQKSTFKN